MAKRSARRTVSEWSDIVADYHRSGLSVQAYCIQNELALATFSKWKRRFAMSEPIAESAPAFVPVLRTEPVTPQINSSISLQIGPLMSLSISVTGSADEQ